MATKKQAPQAKVYLADPNATPVEDLAKMGAPEEKPTLVKSILNVLNGGDNSSIERLAFEQDPGQINTYQALYTTKTRLIPDVILKRICIQDDLVAAILNARSNQLASFGRPRPTRFDIGFIIEPRPGVLDKADQAQKDDIDKRIDQATKILYTCGYTKGWDDNEKMTLPQYFFMSTRNAIGVGRIATEIIYVTLPTGERKFHSFRPIDAGTIYRAAPQKQAADTVRKQARFLLEQLKNKKLEPDRFENDEYAWVQVIEGRPVQAFTSEECVVHNFYPVADIELNGYPVTPLDTVIAAVTTHINITTHNKLYFQNGRASKGMLVIKSEDVNEKVVSQIRQQFNANINNVQNAWRLPVFGVNKDSDVVWTAIDSGGKDMEFQYLSDTNARVILSAFQMSPEELPGYAHLSRGTNSQSLSESNKEYLLEAHRDLGIRPLVRQFEDFINHHIFPLLDPVLAELCIVRLAGLDAETAEKESVRIQQDSPVHGSMDWIQEKVEKKPFGKEWGGEFPFNPQYQAILDKYFTVGQILEQFFGIQGASKDPNLHYMRDQFWFSQQQLIQAQQQAQQQAQMAQQQQAQGGAPGQDGGQGGGGQAQDDEGQQVEDQARESARDQDNARKENTDKGGEFTEGVQKLGDMMKAESQLPPDYRRLLHHQKKTVDHLLEEMKNDAKRSSKDITDILDGLLPRG